jgi:hypothetical protein
MTTIIEGMTPAQFITAMNNNVTECAFTGRSIVFDSSMMGHGVKTALFQNSIGTFNYGKDSSYIRKINNAFASVSLADIAITGAVDSKVYGVTGNGTTDDTTNLQTAINTSNVIIQNGTFKVSAVIIIPSNRTIYIKNAKIKKAITHHDNFFINSDGENGNVNINIIGLGNAELDGNGLNNHDDVSYSWYGLNSKMLYMKGASGVAANQCLETYKYFTIVFTKVTGFEISGLYGYDNAHLGTYLQSCHNGSFHDIYWDCPDVYVIQACFDIARGSDNVEVYNITSSTDDDFGSLAVSKYNGIGRRNITGWDTGDLHDIYFHDIDIKKSTKFQFVVTGDGGKLYNIRYENIRFRAITFIWGAYNFTELFHDVDSLKTDVHDITFNNIQVDTLIEYYGIRYPYLFNFEQSLMDFTVTNLINKTGYPNHVLTAGDQTDNVTINGVQVT